MTVPLFWLYRDNETGCRRILVLRQPVCYA